MDKSNHTGPTTQAEKRPRSPSSSACSDGSEESSHDSVNQRLLVPSVLATAVSESLADTATRLSLGSADLPPTVQEYVNEDARESLGERLAAAFVEQRKNADSIASSLRSTIREGIMGEGLSALLIPHHVVPALVSRYVVLPWWHRTEEDMRVSWKSWELVSYLSFTHPAVVQLMPSSVFRTVQALAIHCDDEVFPASDRVFEAVMDFKLAGHHSGEALEAWLSRVPKATTVLVNCAFDTAAVEAVANSTEIRTLTLSYIPLYRACTASIAPLVKLPWLESLSLGYFKLNTTNPDAVAHSFHRLETLSLYSCCLTSAFLAAIATVTTLRSLSLSQCGVTDEHIEALSTHPALTSLDVAGNDTITDEALRYVARMPHLSRLDVSRCELTNAGIAFLADAPKICDLNLAYVKGLRYGLIEQLARMPTLRGVDLTNYFYAYEHKRGLPGVDVSF